MNKPCERCGDVGYTLGKRGELAHAEPCGCQEACERCGGARYVFRMEGAYEVAAPCTCVSLFARVRLFNDAHVPAGYADKSIASFHHKDPKKAPAEKSLAAAKARFMKYQMSLDARDGRGIVLVGPPGVGKTHLLCALINYMTLQKGVACRFVDFFELTGKIRATFDAPPGGETEASLIEPLVQVPVLAIDDLGKGRGSNWELTIIDQLITRRYNAGRLVLASTNFAPEAPPGGGGPLPSRRGALKESLEERIGDRLYSRLVEMADIVILDGEDRRRVRPATR